MWYAVRITTPDGQQSVLCGPFRSLPSAWDYANTALSASGRRLTAGVCPLWSPNELEDVIVNLVPIEPSIGSKEEA